LKETTIAHHLRHVKAALGWAEGQGMLAKAPRIEMPKLPRGQALMRGRPITAEEFDRLVLAVPKVRPGDSAVWVRLLTGLWLSGLRLGEALALSWDIEAPFSAYVAGNRPVFRILAEAQKGRRDELLPMTPDFADWVLQTPEAERTGPVFKCPVRAGGK
jgi:integrase